MTRAKGTGGLRSWVEIDLGALRHNFGVFRGLAGPGVGIMPAVKADAYGHGLGLVAPELAKAGAAMFGVASAAEGIDLRRLGVKTPVLILGACLREEWEEVVRRGFAAVVSDAGELGWAAAAARKTGRTARAHLKFDTGMGRLGVWHEQAAALARAAAGTRGVRVEGLMTHFACADTDPAFNREQWRRFLAAVFACGPALAGRGGVLVHAANSAGALGFPETHGDMIRPGIALYGSAPLAAWRRRLRPVLAWKAAVVLARTVGAGRTLSYGAAFRAKRRMRVAVVAAGYADGYPRVLSNCGVVVLRGRRCPVVGRVTMDQILVDATRAGGVEAGEAATLVGEGAPVEELAERAGTISYEILTGIGRRVPRVAGDGRGITRSGR